MTCCGKATAQELQQFTVTTVRCDLQSQTDEVEPMQLLVDRIDLASGTGRLIGNTGTSDDIMTLGIGGVLHVLEWTRSGSLHLLSVHNAVGLSDRPPWDDLLPAVYSRHYHFLPIGDPSPRGLRGLDWFSASQMTGTCEILE